MTQYLLDTNIILRGSDQNSPNHSLVRDSVNKIIQHGGNCLITPQVLIEFWVVATRPIEVNGLGWTPQKTQQEITHLLSLFSLLEETPEIFLHWFQLVADHNIKGKRTHDIRLLAVMVVYKIPYLLTFNPDDFIHLPDIMMIQPQDLINSP
jgi:predicted nucleic acid-binding protein